MTIIVEEIKTGKRFTLLGTGFGAYQSMTNSTKFGGILSDVDKGQFAMVCVSNNEGEIGWFESHEVKVISVDGKNPHDILSQ